MPLIIKEIGLKKIVAKNCLSQTEDSRTVKTSDTFKESYNCDKCEASYTSYTGLKNHRENKHEGIRYSCESCNYAATTQSHLNTHKRIKHEGVKYECGQCDSKYVKMQDLRRHT